MNEEAPEEERPVVTVSGAKFGGVLAAIRLRSTPEGGYLYEMKSDPLPELDWEGLKARMQAKGGIRNLSMPAVMPKEEPPRVLDGQTNGIPPVREWVYNGKYSPAISEDMFERRMSIKTAMSQFLGKLDASTQDANGAAAPMHIYYDHVTGYCSLVSQEDMATGRVLAESENLIRRHIERLGRVSHLRSEQILAVIDSMSAHPSVRNNSTNRSFGSVVTTAASKTRTQTKKDKREAKKQAKPGQNYLKIGQR